MSNFDLTKFFNDNCLDVDQKTLEWLNESEDNIKTSYFGYTFVLGDEVLCTYEQVKDGSDKLSYIPKTLARKEIDEFSDKYIYITMKNGFGVFSLN